MDGATDALDDDGTKLDINGLVLAMTARAVGGSITSSASSSSMKSSSSSAESLLSSFLGFDLDPCFLSSPDSVMLPFVHINFICSTT